MMLMTKISSTKLLKFVLFFSVSIELTTLLSPVHQKCVKSREPVINFDLNMPFLFASAVLLSKAKSNCCGHCVVQFVTAGCEADSLCNVELKPCLFLRLWLDF